MSVWAYGGDPVPDFLVNDYTNLLHKKEVRDF